jgi:heat shock protein HslJ
MNASPLLLVLTAALLAGCDGTEHTAQTPATNARPVPTPSASSERKQPTSGITNKYWKLITLEGRPAKMAPGQEREAYFMLRDSSRVTGFGGCNFLNGAYTLQPGNRLRFSNLLGTLRYCQGVEQEGPFLAVLTQTDHYTLTGDTLTLNVGRRAPLAVFHAVDF